jgi:hypothetical protein
VSHRDDARRRLREANPIGTGEAPSPASPGGQALLQRILRRPEPERKRTFWTRRRALIVLVPAAALLVAAGYSLLTKVTDPTVIVCFQQQAANSNRAAVSPTGEDPVGTCLPLWAPGGEFNLKGTPPPPLAACVLKEGGIGVFPHQHGHDVCAELGLAPFGGTDVEPEHRAIQAVQEELVPRFLEGCLDRRTATALVRESLRRHGLTAWQVVAAGPFTEERPCATLALDLPSSTVRLVPVSGPP